MSAFRFLFIIALLVLTFVCSTVRSQQTELKVMSYNVLKGLQGDEENMKRFSQWLKGKSPDIIFYQEMNGFTQKSLENFAMGYGHPYAVIAKESGYSVAITSRFPIVNVQKVLDNMWHGYIYANIHGIHVFAVHLSPFLYQKRIFEIQQILDQARSLPKNSPVIIAGDLNSFQARDSSHYTLKELLKQQKRESNNPDIRNLNQGTYDYSVTRELETAGYIDAINLFHQEFCFTMPTKKYDANFKQKIRIDYIWMNKPLGKKAITAQVLYDEHTEEMSDHYPIGLSLKY